MSAQFVKILIKLFQTVFYALLIEQSVTPVEHKTEYNYRSHLIH